MKIIENIFKVLFYLLFIFCVAIFVLIYTLDKSVSNSYQISTKDNFSISSFVPVTAVNNGTEISNEDFKNAGDTFQVDLKMFGVIPFSKTTLEVVDEMHVQVLGTPFGMKLYTDGVLVIEISEVETKNGKCCPAKDAGLKVGDYIKTANGNEITCNEDLGEVVKASGGKQIKLSIVRNGKNMSIKLLPKLDKENNCYRAGVWVRDSSAGIGTMTFYSPSDNVICGLGHGIYDSDTEEILSIESGELVGAKILSVEKGENGKAGELKGRFTYEKISDISLNSDNGVYGVLTGGLENSVLTEVALKQDVKNGEAQILSTINGDKPELYSCEIKINNSKKSNAHNIIVTITDKKLIAKTGGIVQGMSGSPILQDGKLVGALTHVLLDDATTGYGIFAENMLETAKSVASENKLKNAS